MPVLPVGGIRRSLDQIRAERREVDLVELARRLFSLSELPDAPLARSLVAAAFGCLADALPERLDPVQLTAARHGLLGCAPAGRGSAAPGPAADRLLVPLHRTCFHVVDLETTGLAADRCSILEIGAVRVQGLKLTARFETLVNPGGPIPEAIRRLTGIDARTLVDAPEPRRALPGLRRWLEAEPGAAFVAHNASFDAGFLEHAFRVQGLESLPGPILCTRRLGRRLVPDLRVYKLDALCAHFGVSNPARHRALGDAEATARVLIGLLAIAREQFGIDTLGGLLELQDRAPRARKRSKAQRGHSSRPRSPSLG